MNYDLLLPRVSRLRSDQACPLPHKKFDTTRGMIPFQGIRPVYGLVIT